MSHYLNPDPSELITCPYDPIHQVRASRMPYHLVKCRKNHPGSDHQTCPFNARHIILKNVYRHHIANCPDKAIVERDLAFQNEDDSSAQGNTKLPAYRDPPQVEDSENWDMHPPVLPPVPHVNPAIRNDPTLRAKYESLNKPEIHFKNINEMTPLEKRKYHKAIRKRNERIQEGLPPDPQPGDSDYEETQESEELQVSVPTLREPMAPPKVLQGRGAPAVAADHLPSATRIAANIFGQNIPQEKNLPKSEMLIKLLGTEKTGKIEKESAAMLTALSLGRGRAAPLTTAGRGIISANQGAMPGMRPPPGLVDFYNMPPLEPGQVADVDADDV